MSSTYRNELEFLITKAYLGCAKTADALGAPNVADGIRRLAQDITVEEKTDGSYDIVMPSVEKGK